MKTRLFLLTVLGLTTVPALAEGPTPRRAPASGAQPTPVAPATQPAAPAATAPVVQTAPVVVAPAPVAEPAPPAPVAPGAPPAAQPTDPKLLEWDEPGTPPTQLPPPYVTPHGTSVRLLPPRLRPIEPPPEPEAPRIQGDATEHVALGIGGSFLWHQEHGYGITEQKQTSAFELFASYDVWTPVPAFTLSAGVSLRNEARSIDYDYDLNQNTVQAELMGRLRATPWLDPHLRVAVGGVITRFSRSDTAADVTYEDRAGGVASTFGAGFTLHTPVRLFETRRGHLSALSLGVLVEGGYTLLSDAELAAKPTRDGEVTRATFSFGSLDRSGAYLRIAGVIRF